VESALLAFRCRTRCSFGWCLVSSSSAACKEQKAPQKESAKCLPKSHRFLLIGEFLFLLSPFRFSSSFVFRLDRFLINAFPLGIDFPPLDTHLTAAPGSGVPPRAQAIPVRFAFGLT
jgi:hypothetical protein